MRLNCWFLIKAPLNGIRFMLLINVGKEKSKKYEENTLKRDFNYKQIAVDVRP